MKKILLATFFSFVASTLIFANSETEKFIQTWGSEYTGTAISFIYNMEENWIPIEYMQWAKNNELSDSVKKIHKNFKFEDFELLNIIFVNDKAILQLPYGKQSFKMIDVSSNKNGYFVMMSKLKSEENIKNLNSISKIWNVKGENISMNFSFSDAILTISNEYNSESHQYVKVSDSALEKLYDCIINNSNLSSDEYDEVFKNYSSKKRKASHLVKINSFYKNNCNLKLRSAENPSTGVIAIMASGTNVKILELGEIENINGIENYWVKVEVLPGAKDSRGKPIQSGTVGWCYGGYLE